MAEEVHICSARLCWGLWSKQNMCSKCKRDKKKN